ncbi:MAG: ABC transporter permease [Candidatus Eremiobacteraeota bacterium]|nr:ABC transporter permease [Candidatus Eremiobacteraeota bacterium]
MISLRDLATHALTHLQMAGSALLVAAIIALPLGAFSAHQNRLRGTVLGIANVGRVIPSLAMLTFMLPFLGVGLWSAVIALTLLAIPPIAINTDLGFRAVPTAATDAARGMGMTPWQQLLRVEWPLALPVLFAGVRTASTELIASATLAAFIGAGGLGEYILRGLQANDPQLLIVGSLAVATLAIAVELLFVLISRLIGEHS